MLTPLVLVSLPPNTADDDFGGTVEPALQSSDITDGGGYRRGSVASSGGTGDWAVAEPQQQSPEAPPYDALDAQRRAHAGVKARAFRDPTAVHRVLESAGDGTPLQVPATIGAAMAAPPLPHRRPSQSPGRAGGGSSSASSSMASKAAQDAIRKAKVLSDLRRQGGGGGGGGAGGGGVPSLEDALASQVAAEGLDEAAGKLYGGFAAAEAALPQRPALPPAAVSVRDLVMKKKAPAAVPGGATAGALTTARRLAMGGGGGASDTLPPAATSTTTTGGYAADASFTQPPPANPAADRMLARLAAQRADELRRSHDALAARAYGGGK
jgi:hypothetical protein